MKLFFKPLFPMFMGCVGLLVLSGCLGNRDWQYPPSSTGKFLSHKAEKPVMAKAVVLPLEDLRGKETKEEYWKAAIPLVPFGDAEYQRPESVEDAEEVDVVHFNPPHDFSKAIAAEFANAGIFSSVKFVESEQMETADVVFRGRLRSTDWKRRLYTYLLGPGGVVLWMLGLPMSEASTGLEMDLRLTSSDDPERVLWSMTMDYDSERYDGPYYGLEAAVESYPQAIQEALQPAILDLVNLADKDPKRLMPR